MKWLSGNQRGGTVSYTSAGCFFLPGTDKSHWATSRTSRAWLRLHCHSLFLTLRPSTPSGHLKGRLTHFITSRYSDSSSSPSPSIPKLVAASASSSASSASQQLPDNASTDNRLSCCLQVCQPWACQINVRVNSKGGRGKVKRGESG